MSATETAPTTERVQPGDDFSHLCATHFHDHECDAAPEACVAFCGFDFGGDDGFDFTSESCVVCDEMAETRGDFDTAPCRCSTCQRIWAEQG